jgi:hypothetical protein
VSKNSNGVSKIIPIENSKFILEDMSQFLYLEDTEEVKCGTFFGIDHWGYPKILSYVGSKLKALIEFYSVDGLGFYEHRIRHVEFEDFTNCGLEPLNLTNNNKHNEITLFPNPAHNSLNLSTGGYMGTVLIYDYVGKKIFEAKTENPNNTEINISNLPQGLYIVEFTNHIKSHKMKFIKE